MTFDEAAVMEAQRLERELARVRKVYEREKPFPEKNLHCVKNGVHTKCFESYYCKGKRVRKYIPSKQADYVRKLALGTYLRLYIPDLENRLALLRRFIRKSQITGHRAERLLRDNTRFPKSEDLIAHELYMNGIPFHYEEDLFLGERVFSPDFTILHPMTGQTVIWEHFGMMSDPDYARKAYQKLETYRTCNYVPGVNMIATFESASHPLSVSAVSAQIHSFFAVG